jgi:hypothetical protein
MCGVPDSVPLGWNSPISDEEEEENNDIVNTVLMSLPYYGRP